MEIREMTMAEVETRSAELAELLNDENADLEAIDQEVGELEERKAEILKETEERSKQVAEVIGTEKNTIETFETEEVRKPMEMKELRNSPEYIDAFADYLKGDDKQVRALLSTNAENGTVAVPDFVYDEVKTAWENNSLLNHVRKVSVPGNLKVQFEDSATGAVIHEEGANAPAEEELVLGIVEMIPKSFKKWISLSDEIYDMRGEEFMRYIYSEVSNQIAKAVADALIAQIVGLPIASTATEPGQDTLIVNEINLASIIRALGLLADNANNPIAVMNRGTWAYIKGLQVEANYAFDPFEGMEVVFNNSLPVASATLEENTTYIIVGDFENGALANFPKGDDISLKFDDLSLAEHDLIKIVGRQFVAAYAVAPNHFARIATTNK